MKIAFLTSEFPHQKLKRSAGIGSSIKNLAKGLVERGHEVTVFAAFQKRDLAYMDGKIRIVSIQRRGFIFGGWYLERKHIQRVIQREIDQTGIQVLEAPDWTGITAFMKFSVPLVIRLHGSDGYFCKLEGRQQKWKNSYFEKKALKGADHIISVSDFAAEMTSKIFDLKKGITTIYNGIDTRQFNAPDGPVERGQLLYFGTIIRKKGVFELVEIFNKVIEKHPDASLVLIGKDNKDIKTGRSTLPLMFRRFSKKAKPRVKYIPEVPYQEIKNYIARANVVVLPSLAEAFPMTWLETLAMEKAFVSSDIGWANELMVNGKTGYMADPKNHEDYADKIVDLLNDFEKAKEFGRNGRQHIIRNFSLDIIIEKNINFYSTLINNNEPA